MAGFIFFLVCIAGVYQGYKVADVGTQLVLGVFGVVFFISFVNHMRGIKDG